MSNQYIKHFDRYLFNSEKLYFNLFSCSNVQNATSFQHMARMMDSLILNEFPPYTFTKITTTHRPVRTNNGMTASKLLAKSTANLSTATSNLNNNNNNNGVASSLGMSNGLRQSPLQKTKVPMQGLHSILSLCSHIPFYFAKFLFDYKNEHFAWFFSLLSLLL